MRGIRQTKPATYVVRVSIGGVQTHIGSFRTYNEALRVRNAREAPPEGSAPAAGKASSAGSAGSAASARTTIRRRGDGVRERFSGGVTVYDVIKYTHGHYLPGGRYRTREAAEAAHASLVPNAKELEAIAAVAAHRHEPGISIRFVRGRGRGRGQARSDPIPRFVARTFRRGGRSLGSYDTIEGARDAIKQANALDSNSASEGD